jgi:hypothetical protein
MVKMRTSIKYTIISFVGLSFTLGACGDAGFGAACEMPKPVLEKACSNQSADNNTDQKASCVQEPSYDCDSRICIVYQGSSPYCAADCSAESLGQNCQGGDGLCATFKFAGGFDAESNKFLDSYVCVKKSQFNE